MKCAICLEGEDTDEAASLSNDYTTPCQHKFHVKCIQLWQERSVLCPVCRQPFATYRIHPHYQFIYKGLVVLHVLTVTLTILVESTSAYDEILSRLLLYVIWAASLGATLFQNRLIGGLRGLAIMGFALWITWMVVVLSRILLQK